jgi:hypothetical protein
MELRPRSFLRCCGVSVINVIYVGRPEDEAAALKKRIMGITVGETGYVYVLDSSGKYIVSQRGKRDGENIMESKDANGRLFIRDIIEKAKKIGPGEIAEDKTVVQRNAASAEELSSIAEELSARAESLHETLAFFKLVDDDTTAI